MHINGVEINFWRLIPLSIVIAIAIGAILWLRSGKVSQGQWRAVTWLLIAGTVLTFASIVVPKLSDAFGGFTTFLLLLAGFLAYGKSRDWTLRQPKAHLVERERV